MLQQLSISNYALIDELEIGLSDGMTIITGETGAGKSILLGALGLLLGNRADSGALYSKDRKCIIEGVFATGDYNLEDFFRENDLDLEKQTIIRREIGKDGKSRAFVNDTPVNLSVLRDLGGRLIEIHSQHETLTLNDSEFQMMVVDSCAGNDQLLSSYTNVHGKLVSFEAKLTELREAESRARADQDYLQFQFDELSQASLNPGEQEQLENELSVLNNSENISLALSRATATLKDEESNVMQALASVSSLLQPVASFHTGIRELLDRLKSAQIEIRDIAFESERIGHSVAFDPGRAEIVSDRLDLIYKLQQKHRVQSVGDLLRIAGELGEKLESFSSLGDEISKLEKECKALSDEVRKKAQEIRKLRQKTIPSVEQQIQSMLSSLGMKHAVLKIQLDALPENQFRSNGADSVRFLFSANKGVEYRELHKVASGGELSRLMLSIKSMLASLRGLPTIIFDEIDTGISGEVAQKVGQILKKMSKERQVIAITHLPQMAGKGDSHLFVFKKVIDGRTVTRLRMLSREERVEEIARMLSGEKPSAAAMENARELLSH